MGIGPGLFPIHALGLLEHGDGLQNGTSPLLTYLMVQGSAQRVEQELVDLRAVAAEFYLHCEGVEDAGEAA